MSENDNRSYEGLSLDEIEELEQQEKKEQKKKERQEKFNIFNRLNKDGKGVEKDEEIIADNPTLKNFFKLVGRKINQLLTVNIMMVFGKLLTNSAQLFADVRTCWNSNSVRRVTGYELEGNVKKS